MITLCIKDSIKINKHGRKRLWKLIWYRPDIKGSVKTINVRSFTLGLLGLQQFTSGIYLILRAHTIISFNKPLLTFSGGKHEGPKKPCLFLSSIKLTTYHPTLALPVFSVHFSPHLQSVTPTPTPTRMWKARMMTPELTTYNNLSMCDYISATT